MQEVGKTALFSNNNILGTDNIFLSVWYLKHALDNVPLVYIVDTCMTLYIHGTYSASKEEN